MNEFAAKRCKRFPPYLNNISTLSCITWNVHCARVPLLQKETPVFIPLQLCPPNSPDLNSIDIMWEILQETVYETCIADLEDWSYQRRHWQMATAMTTWSSLAHSVLNRCFSSFSSVMHILYTFCCNSPHTL